MPRRPRGWLSGWAEYRYGPKSKLPTGRKPRRLPDERRRRLVELVADVMRAGFEAGAPSRFAYEASCRHGVRAALCLGGWTWHEADAAAEDVTSRALALTGARRPTWKEGQPEWTQDGHAPIERTRCLRCGKELPEGQRKFCSRLCGQAWRLHMSRLQEAGETAAYDTAVWGTTRWRTARR